MKNTSYYKWDTKEGTLEKRDVSELMKDETHHYHYLFVGYNESIETGIITKNFQYLDKSEVEVLAKFEDEALLKARKQIDRKFFNLLKSVECHYANIDHNLATEIQTEMNLQQLKMLSKQNKL